MDTVVPETGVTLDTGLLRQDVVILSLQEAHDLREAEQKGLSARSPRSDWPRYVPSLVVYLVAEAGSVDNGQGDAGALLIQLELCYLSATEQELRRWPRVRVPTVTGLILTPSSTWALLASSDSLWPSTVLPHRVLTKVVRPKFAERSATGSVGRCALVGRIHLTGARCSADHQAELDPLLDVLLPSDHLL